MTQGRGILVFILALPAIGLLGWESLWAEVSDSQEVEKAEQLPEPLPSTGVRDFAIRKLGTLNITNRRGDILVRGWNQDRIRVIYRIKAYPLTFPLKEESWQEKRDRMRKGLPAPEARVITAEQMLKSTELSISNRPNGVEVRAKYGMNLSIEDKLEERDRPRARMDLEVLAPARMKLRVWALDQAVAVSSWRNDISVRADSGPIEISKHVGGKIEANCPDCKFFLRRINGDLRVVTRGGRIYMEDITGESLYAETLNGDMELSRVASQQMLVTDSGTIAAERQTGRIEYRSNSGGVILNNASGFVSGSNTKGNTEIKMRHWRFEDRGIIESKSGSISLALPASFSGLVDLYSREGAVKLDMAHKRSELDSDLPVEMKHYKGRIGDGGKELRVHSGSGDIRVFENQI